ncbi:MAG TPA: Lrp/AsnC ligand binding domain-containing protein [Candidatus Nitrosotalea sp.]|nr:Lrp/AsnC ligand binding domain-containing protein [Nitrososphaerota archaeon]HKU33169.1 Lrp/AsnC ligand binding domain-containing protein [Candidatus Nitrosotalea sp.]
METAYVMINCEMGSESSIIEKIKPIEGVKEVLGVFGNYDVLVKIQSSKIDEIRRTIVANIRSIDKIRCTTTLMCAN